MGLFDKKYCDVCGAKIGLLGNRKLEDGNLCKDCAKKLSPWFSDRRQSTVAQIKDQLAYREENKAKVAAFHTTRTLGDTTKVLLDEDAGKFMVASTRDLAEENPDVLNFSDVTGCSMDIDENRYEEKRRDAQGNEVSFSPPRYRFTYDFSVIINVNHPYFDEIRFRLNSGIEGRGSLAYHECETMGEEIKDALLKVRQTVRDTAAAASAPKAAVTCPWCGATTTPTAAGCCEYCGGALAR